VVFSGGVAGFPIPPLRYYVGTGQDDDAIRVLAAGEHLAPIAPRGGSRLAAGALLNFNWLSDPDAIAYRIDLEADGERVLEAMVTSAVSSYSAPPWIRERYRDDLRWRVVAFGPSGDPISRSDWVAFEIDD
jgi:hypothetical protein